jgi:hypothetical protein
MTQPEPPTRPSWKRTTTTNVTLRNELLIGLGPPLLLVLLLLRRITMVTMGGDLQPGSLADRLLTGLGQPQINP